MAHLAPVPFAAGDTRPALSSTSRQGPKALGTESKTLAGMLLAATMAALLVVADQVISTWSDGNLLAAWVALWTVTFATLAFLASPLRRMSIHAARKITQWRARTRARREEAQMWEFARHDPRVMAEIRVAQGRSPS